MFTLTSWILIGMREGIYTVGASCWFFPPQMPEMCLHLHTPLGHSHRGLDWIALPVVQMKVLRTRGLRPLGCRAAHNNRTIISEVKSLNRVQLFAIPWTVAYQAPLSMGFSRQEYWSGVPIPSPTIVNVYKVLGVYQALF